LVNSNALTKLQTTFNLPLPNSIFETIPELPELGSFLVQFNQPQDASNAVVVITTTSVQKCTSVPGLWG